MTKFKAFSLRLVKINLQCLRQDGIYILLVWEKTTISVDSNIPSLDFDYVYSAIIPSEAVL